jgi:hypothetical protein
VQGVRRGIGSPGARDRSLQGRSSRQVVPSVTNGAPWLSPVLTVELICVLPNKQTLNAYCHGAKRELRQIIGF